MIDIIDVNQWMPLFCLRLQNLFPGRLRFIGLQGSYARQEATETSDLDVVVILEQLAPTDLLQYDALLSELPHREKICGFISGWPELRRWTASDLFHFYYDTIPFYGNLDELLNQIDVDAIQQTILNGACQLYHGCIHNFLHKKSFDLLQNLYKSATFVIRAIHYLEFGEFVRKKADLLAVVREPEHKILEMGQKLADRPASPTLFQSASTELFLWTQQRINRF